jgi:hypothetical protein
VAGGGGGENAVSVGARDRRGGFLERDGADRVSRAQSDDGRGLKRHAGGYVRETQVAANASARIGFYGVTPVTQPSGADQAAVRLGNIDGEIDGLTISDPPTQAEVQALRDKCEELADDVRALSTLVHALRGGRSSR